MSSSGCSPAVKWISSSVVSAMWKRWPASSNASIQKSALLLYCTMGATERVWVFTRSTVEDQLG